MTTQSTIAGAAGSKKAMKPEDCDVLIFEHMRAGDLDAVMDLFEADATFVVSDDNMVGGHAAIRPFIEGWIGAEKLEWTHGPKAFVDASGTLALLRGTWAATFKKESGELEVLTGKNVEVVRRQADGSWRFVIDHATGAN